MKKNFETKEEHPIRLGYYLLGTVALWSILMGLSLAWNLRTEKSGFLEAARIEARTAFDKDVVYRRWNAACGGVYAPVTGITQPNPYLDVPERDITTPLGKELTKINPAYMTRQVHELALKAYGIRGHITSLNPIRPANAPDPWETRALRTFKTGLKEVSSVEEIEGNEYMRLMRPLLTEKGCLKCHAAQGYKLGDIRGGISVSIPMAPHMAITQSHILALCVGHLLLWLAGLVGIGFGFRRLNQQIHKRIGVEEALRESEKTARQYLDIAGVAFVALDNEGDITLINQRGLEILGYRLEELLGKNWFRTCLPDRFQKDVLDVYLQLIRGEVEPVKYYENSVLTKDGKERIIAWHNSVLRNPGGKIVGTLSSGDDITERTKAEEALRESEEKYRTLFEESRDAIYITTRNGLFIDANQSFFGLFGYNREEIAMINARQLYVNPDDGHRFRGEIEQKGYVKDFEVKMKKKDGTGMDCLLAVTVQRANDGNIFGYQGIIRDMTEHNKLETQLRQAQKMEAIGTLAGGVAHDFNNILTTIIGNAGLALEDVGKDDTLREEIEEIKIAGERAASLTRQLLAFSRKQIVHPKILDLNELLTDIEKMLGRLIGEDIELLTIPRPELWQVEADPGQIEQVIMNLAINAKDAMPKGGKLTVETANVDLDGNYFRKHGIKEKQRGTYVMLAVSDTGIGMDKETQEHIFEPFFTTKEIGKGTGLGLSTVYGIVKQNNGFIWIYSEPGQGSTFKVYLPKAKGDVASEKKEQHPVIEIGGSETVLLVEDDDGLRKLARTVLKQRGYKVLEAENGEDALRVSEAHDGSIDLLITDVVMPKMGGKEVVKRLQPLYPQMKVIYMSGYTDNAIVHHGVLASGLNFFEKPFTPEGLARKVREILDTE